MLRPAIQPLNVLQINVAPKHLRSRPLIPSPKPERFADPPQSQYLSGHYRGCSANGVEADHDPGAVVHNSDADVGLAALVIALWPIVTLVAPNRTTAVLAEVPPPGGDCGFLITAAVDRVAEGRA